MTDFKIHNIHSDILFNNGTWEIDIAVGTNQWDSGGTYYYVDDIFVHDEYNPTHFENDIALVHIESSIEFDERVQPITYNANEVPPGEILQVTGWGALQVLPIFKNSD